MQRTPLLRGRKTPSTAQTRTPSTKPCSFYEQRYKAAACIYTGNKASKVRQNNAQIVKYIESVNPIPRDFVPPAKLKVRDLIIDAGKLHEEGLGKRTPQQNEFQVPDEEDDIMSSEPERSPGFKSESQSITLWFFLENGSETEELYAAPIAGRIVLKKLKLQLGRCGVEAVDAFEVFRKGKLAWTLV
ncbi:hypothetical protein BT96DRAFT_994363 [Gymnopus androsaceus JB14]|uniref:Uncharacterized protein n=1 Tax=Gymnopus androsaceus JB14 TaxID=1447944 RepID=A0A6A4HJC9_9AGAR|nr:hypothetical protein BT96DRAFT_994363 [Gymnopus androsaceus JB14]